MRALSALVTVGILLLAVSCTVRPPVSSVPIPTAAPGAAPRAPAPTGSTASDKPFEPAPDAVDDDPSLPAGTVRVTVVDADGEPIARAPVALETVIVRAPSNGLDVVAKDTAVADGKGTAIFRKVSGGGDHRHVASTRRGDGTFGVEPFSLSPRSGKRVTLHAYETVRDIEHALVAMQTMMALAVHADTIEVEVLYRIYNVGRVAWVPADVRVAFPPGVTGFLASDLGMPVRVDDITEAGFTLTGTVAPGQHELNYHYQIPRHRSGTQRVVLEQPPRVAQARVLLSASGGARLTVAGFPAATTATGKNGTPWLMTERMGIRAEGGVKILDITLAGDPP
jgi:hypothetical protein